MSSWGMINQVRRWFSRPLVIDYRHHGHMTTSVSQWVPMYSPEAVRTFGHLRFPLNQFIRRKKTAFIRLSPNTAVMNNLDIEISFGYLDSRGRSVTDVELFSSPPSVAMDVNSGGIVPVAYNVSEKGFKVAFLKTDGIHTSGFWATPQFTMHIKGEKKNIFWWEKFISTLVDVIFWLLVTYAWWQPYVHGG